MARASFIFLFLCRDTKGRRELAVGIGIYSRYVD
jgi:hypothetical protein